MMENIYHTIRGRTKSPRTLESNSKGPLSAAKPSVVDFQMGKSKSVSKSRWFHILPRNKKYLYMFRSHISHIIHLSRIIQSWTTYEPSISHSSPWKSPALHLNANPSQRMFCRFSLKIIVNCFLSRNTAVFGRVLANGNRTSKIWISPRKIVKYR